MAKARKVTRPTHRAYAVDERQDRDNVWREIGAAFPHQDGKGFNIRLQALPVDGQLVLRTIEPRSDAEKTDK